MSDLDSPPDNSSSNGVRAFIAWIVIIASVIYVMKHVVDEQPRVAADMQSSGVDDAQFRFVARSALGSSVLAKRVGTDLKASAAQLMKPIDSIAKTDAQRVDAAIIAAEISGPADARQRLDRIATTEPALQNDIALLRAIYTSEPTTRETSATTAPATIDLVSSPTSQASRAAIQADRGWFGQLATEFNHDNFEPARARILSQCVRLYTAFLVGLGTLGLLGLAGLILLIIAIVLLAIGKLRTKFIPIRPRNGKPVFLEAFALYLALYILIGALLPRLPHDEKSKAFSLLAIGLSTLILPVAIAWPVINGMSLSESRRGFGWVEPLTFFREAFFGVVGYITALPILAIAYGVMLFLMRFSRVPATHPIVEAIPTGDWRVLLAIFLLACVWAPIMEETMFRGALLNHLRGRWRWFAAAPLVGLIFAAIHPQGWTFIPMLGTIGIVLAGIREWRGSIIASMVAHGLNNGVVLSLAVLTLRS